MRVNNFVAHLLVRFITILTIFLFSFYNLAFARSDLRRVNVCQKDDLSRVLSEANTQYVIRYNHDLSKYPDGVVIGKNSVLEFKKGSLKNGKITFNNTKIKSKQRRIFENNIYSGKLDVEIAFPEWFGAVGDGRADDTQAIQNAMDVAYVVSGVVGRVYAVRTDSPYKHCLTVKHDSLKLIIDLKDINEYNTSDYRGRGIIFIDNHNGFSFKGSISSVNVQLPISSKTGMTLENSRAGIVCYGDCGNMDVNLTCSNLYCGVFHGAFMYDEYLYRNGTIGVNNSTINVRANRVAYPVSLNYANNCEIYVYGEHMHRCVFLCGDHNKVVAQGRNYYATAAPAHVILFSNVLKDKDGRYRIVTCNHNDVTYKQLEGETENLPEGSVFQFQELGLSFNNKVPHSDYSFVDNTINIYCCRLGGDKIQHLYKSFASNWKYDKDVKVECTFNIYGDISSYLSYSSFVFYADTEDKITINNHSEQQLVYTFSYSGNPKSEYIVNGDSRSLAFGTKEYPFYGTLRAKGKNVYVNTSTGSPTIKGKIYVEGEFVEIVENKNAKSRNVVVKRTRE